jgi:hypothetical protein
MISGMLTIRILRALLLLLLIAALPSAKAMPVQWYFNGVTFNDGGTASGSFLYDATFQRYSSVDIVTTAGTASAGQTYSWPALPQLGSPTLLLAFPLPFSPNFLTGTQEFIIQFSSPLTDAGGTIPLNVGTQGPTSGEAICLDATCNSASGIRLAAGGVVSSAPEPSTMVCLISAGLMLVGRRRARSWSRPVAWQSRKQRGGH